MSKVLYILTVIFIIAINTIFASQQTKAPSRRVELFERPNSAKGRIVFVNSQSRMNPSNIVAVIIVLEEHLKNYNFEIVNHKGVNESAETLKKRFNANVAIVIVDNDYSPMLLAAPEESWAIVNVKKALKNLKGDFAIRKFFDSRCRKEILRAFACASGGIGSTFPGNIMNACDVTALDVCEEFIPFDKVAVFKRHLTAVGVTPRKFLSYRRACQEGWAPAPTNDIQRAIWEKVRSDKERGPTNPISIPPPKRK